ncbi:MAG: hypothetical protein M3Q31_17270 [Actinomycetota bacterium]|nr:hypothetical protein [Actinomycetota bacterium]
MRGLRIIVAVEAAILVLAVGLVLHSEGHKRFPPTIAVTSAQAPRHVVLPVSVDLGSRGSTTTSALVLVRRGGRATAVPARGDHGSAAFRGTTGKRARHRG